MMRKIYIARIEGLGVDERQAAYCYPVLPLYGEGLPGFSATLAEPPSGVSSEWDLVESRASVGGFRLSFGADADLPSWWRTRPAPLGWLLDAISSSATGFDLRPGHGLATGDVLYLDRETVVDVVVAGDSVSSCTRGACGSTAATHAADCPIWDVPPALTGRLVTVSWVDADTTDSSDEVVILRGYCAGEMAAGLHWPTIEVVERWTTNTLGRSGPLVSWSNGTVPVPGKAYSISTSGTYNLDPIGQEWHPDGGYLWAPEAKVALRVSGSGALTGGRYVWDGLTSVIGTDIAKAKDEEHLTYVALADTTQPYPTFGYTPDAGSLTPSANPVVILLNLLVSTEAGTNTTSGRTSYDIGARLAPNWSLGVPIARVDQDTFEAAIAEFGTLVASRFWLGVEAVTIEDIAQRLLGSMGYALATRRDGVWTLLRLRDVYPGDTTITLDDDAIVEADSIEHVTVARPLDTTRLACDADPDGDRPSTVTLEEVDARRYYPDAIGAVVEYDTCYAAADITGEAYDLASARIRRLSDRLATVRLTVSADYVDQLHTGQAVTVQSAAIVSPATGGRDVVLSGIITGCDVEWGPDVVQARLTVALTDAPKVGLVAPAAEVTAWNAGTGTVTCQDHAFTPSTATVNDVGWFAAGDYLILCDLHGTARSSVTSANKTAVLSRDSATNTIVVTNDGVTPGGFKTSGGASVTPAATDVIVYAREGEVTSTQRTTYAHAGPGDIDEATTYSSGREAYVWGD